MRDKLKISGFTLVEMLTAVSLFTIVVFISLGALVSIFDANKRAQATKTVIDNLNLSLEDMTRTVRFGTKYYCGVAEGMDDTNDCSVPKESLSVTFNGHRIIYSRCGNEIRKGVDEGNCNDMNAITAPEAVIDYLKFYVFNSDPSSSDSKQPYAIAVIKGHVGNKATIQSSFSIETMMSQRKLDIP